MMREVVRCSGDDQAQRIVGTNHCAGDRHGWGCPLSDPMGDMLRMMMDPLPNPILEQARQDIVKAWMK